MKYLALIIVLLGIALLLVSKARASGADGIVVRQIEPLDSELLEEWERVTDDEDVLGVSAAKTNRPKWTWQVFIAVAEFVREEPLESTLVDRVTSVLGQVEGVKSVVREDREVWAIEGDAGGEGLVRAASTAVDSLAPRLREHMGSL